MMLSPTRKWLIKELCDPYYNITQTKLAKMFKISRRQVSRIKHGEIK